MGRAFAAIGAVWTFIELLDFFGIYERAHYSKFAVFPVLAVGILYAVLRVRPVRRVTYKVPGRDLCIEVKIGDVLEANGGVVVSSNTTFDTDIAGGLISAQSLQGQFASRFFDNNTQTIDQLLDGSLAGTHGTPNPRPFGKQVEYPIGTVALVPTHGNNYYFLAMSVLNDQGNARSDVGMIDRALASLWAYISATGDLQSLAIPLLGTGRGRIIYPRKKMIERIAQSFVDASRDRQFAPKLAIYVRSEDAANFEINLFEVRDYLSRSIHP
jgi:hypothetical protein